ncbi:MAG: hypothetical protein A4C66_15270 [Nitrospira sp. HN-bin3]|uniref:hypothetical protein n=1 Tax=Nitrospira cf. moscoviensis SBR1015 TaxID=96242 RepID=UPI000A0D35FF|nr:hypothetical protein [Nitrospira cf. moscoviensis SBR1015]OQW44758.1 MAG: hypothetical protein A4C66_15270 [Nitrospira sp. HN-bin3]
MPKRSSKPKDVNVTAFEILKAATEPEEPAKKDQPAKNPAAVAMGRLGGLKGGKARAAKLSARQRKSIARKAAQKRWAKRKQGA